MGCGVSGELRHLKEEIREGTISPCRGIHSLQFNTRRGREGPVKNDREERPVNKHRSHTLPDATETRLGACTLAPQAMLACKTMLECALLV
jgi:hypothetical protein